MACICWVNLLDLVARCSGFGVVCSGLILLGQWWNMDGGPAAAGGTAVDMESDRHIVPVVAAVLTQMVTRNDTMLQQASTLPFILSNATD